MWVGLGDSFGDNDKAQNPANHIGTVIHINADGGAASGNPLLGRAGAEVWSLGRRNIEGTAMHP